MVVNLASPKVASISTLFFLFLIDGPQGQQVSSTYCGSDIAVHALCVFTWDLANYFIYKLASYYDHFRYGVTKSGMH